MKYVSPSTRETAFNCPHCGALAKQEWYSLRANKRTDDEPLPRILDPEQRKAINLDDIEDLKKRKELHRMVDKLIAGCPVLGDSGRESYGSVDLLNVFIARCFNCKDMSVWIHQKLVFPQRGEAQQANADLSADIRLDYDEASGILDRSPRGAAALIRLAIQKLCIELGQSGKDLNKDIGALVSDGLDAQVQMALDAVRVIGNNAVHPGQINLRDDHSTAETLFMLLNLIAERMITQPKQVKEVYASLPEGARKAIEGRDADA